MSISLDKEVATNEEGVDDDTDATAADADADADADTDTDTTAYDAAPDNNDYVTMPPKVKPLPTKPTKKDIAAATAKPPPPAAAATATSFSVDATDPLTDNYYADGDYDYADVVFRVNRTIQKGEYQVRVAEDSLLVSFVPAISLRSFDKKILCKIMGVEYHTTRTALASLLGTTRRWR